MRTKEAPTLLCCVRGLIFYYTLFSARKHNKETSSFLF